MLSEYVVAWRESTSVYEVHKAGCKHVVMGAVEPMVRKTGVSAASVAATYTAENEGCYAKVSPCAKVSA